MDDEENGSAVDKKAMEAFSLSLKRNAHGVALAFAIAYVSDVPASIAWYESLYGWKVHSNMEDNWVEFETGSTKFALHKAGKHGHASSNQKEHTAAGSTSLGWAVTDLPAFHERAQQLGVRVVTPPAQQPWGGWQATYADPDGNIQSVTEVK